MARELLKGNDAMAEAAIRAGCRFFAGYPITPQTEILEYLSTRMEKVGGVFVQTESEISGISMVYGAAAAGARTLTSSSGPGYSLMQEGISYIVSAELPCVIIDVMRYGNGLGDIFQAQGDYWQVVKNGGHGDYRSIVLAPSSVQEAADLTFEAYDLAEKYRNPVIVLSDASISQMMEAVELPEMQEHDIDKFEWSVKGTHGGIPKSVSSNSYKNPDYDEYIQRKYASISSGLQRWEEIQVKDAEFILVSYGISSRICAEIVERGRADGLKIGMIRPITLYPFPVDAFAKCQNAKAFITVELSALAQMAEDVAMATGMKKKMYSILGGQKMFYTEDVYRRVREIIEDAEGV